MTTSSNVLTQSETLVLTRPRGGPGRLVLHLAAVGSAALALAWFFPAVMGTGWIDIAAALTSLSALSLAGLVALWAVGKLAHSVALAAAMPGLDRRRALTLSLTGAAVSNVLPLGGAAGVALNYRMSRSWGFPGPAIATYTVVVNLCDVIMKFLLPLALIPVAAYGQLPPQLTGDRAPVLAAGAGGLAAVGVGALGLLACQGLLRRIGLTLRPDSMPHRAVLAVETVVGASRDTIVRSWSRLGAGMVVYTALLLALLAACLHVAGAAVPFGLVLAAFCGERLLTLVGITPAGLGVVELGLAGVLMLAPGVSGAAVASGILLYRLATVGLGVPVGGALLAWWVWRRRVDAGCL